ncbi:GTP cyclohydrolase I, partial [Kocuria rosea]
MSHDVHTDRISAHDVRAEAFDPPYPDPAPALEAGAGAVDQPRVAAAVRELLLAIGEDPDREGLQGTPGRVARAYAEMFAGLHQDPA